ncbi:response regulator transcription factor [Silvibacterium acidisoli]|uniref:response regulator transcription factor n=1 Tax=Acidobacteriaceae bacterium ZG23-2 TaxID=2883246 RepID=UPI00406C0A5E
MRILVVEDDRELAASIRIRLEDEGGEVTHCFDGGAGLRQAELHDFDVLLLEATLPVLDGFELTRRLRLQGLSLPIVFLTTLDTPQDIVRGLNQGADDYITKPFDFEVLVARLRARVRAAVRGQAEKLRFAGLYLDMEKREAMRAGRKLDLTRTEFSVLHYLMQSRGRIAQRRLIIESIWPDKDVSENNLETFIRYLRQKVDPPGMPRLIHTERGVGYYLRDSAR